VGHSIVHFEVPADDRGRLKQFYGGLFGWAFEDVEGMEYTLVNTGNGLNGGIVKRGGDVRGILNYIDVPDVEDFVHRASRLGAEVVQSRSPIPSIGWYAILKDPEGNLFAIWQDDQYAGF
jgi:uncharacterized protein